MAPEYQDPLYQSNYSEPEPGPEAGYDVIMNVAVSINKSYLWVILAFGLPGNVAAIYTIFRMRHLGSFGYYVVLLAVVDSLTLIAKICNYQLIYNQVNIHAVGCKLIIFLANFLITFANWILVLMAVERLIAVKFPLKIQSFNYRNSVIASVIVGILLAAPYLPILWITSISEEGYCYLDSTDPSLVTFIFWAQRCLYGLIPFVTLLVSNLFIANVIRNSFRFRHTMRRMVNSRTVSTTSSIAPDISIQRQVMLMLFTTTFVFVLFTFPLCVFTVVEVYWKIQVRTREDAIKYLLKQIANVMCDCNHAINFYLYFFSARKFRHQFIRHSIFSSSQRVRTTRF